MLSTYAYIILFSVLIIKRILSSTPIWNFSSNSHSIDESYLILSSASYLSETILTYTRNGLYYMQTSSDIINITFTQIDSFAIIDNIFYICPKDASHPSIYKYNPSNKTIEKISIPSTITGSNQKWTVKCLYGVKTKMNNTDINTVIVIPFIGTQYIYGYDTYSSQWGEKLTEPTYFTNANIESQIIGSGNSYYQLYATLVCNSDIKATKYQVFFENHRVSYSKTMSNDFEDSKTHLGTSISYINTSVTNAPVFYSITYKDNQIVMRKNTVSSQNKNINDSTYSSTFPLSDKLGKIEDIQFINDSPLYFYNITDKNNNIIWGIIDITTNQVLFNSNEPIKSMSSLAGNSIKVTTDNGSFEICPYMYSNGLCTECKANEVLFINSFGNNICVIKTNVNINGNYGYCTSTQYFDEETLSCKSCSSNITYTFYPDNICIKNCDDSIYSKDETSKKCYDCNGYNNTYYLIGKYCYDTKPSNTYVINESSKLLRECYDKCSQCNEGGNSSDMKCTKCKDGYLTGTNCFSQCSEKTYQDEANKECVKCPDGQYKYLGRTNQCQSPPSNGFIVVDTDYNIIEDCYSHCKSCSASSTDESNQKCTSCNNNYYLHNSNCLDECPDYLYEDTSQFQCINCASIKKVKYIGRTNQCIDSPSTPFYYTNTTYSIIDDCYSLCGSCSSKGDSSNHQCNSCIAQYQSDPITGGNCIPICNDINEGVYQGVCQNCKTLDMVKYENEVICVDKPQYEFTYINETYGVIAAIISDPELDTLLDTIIDQILEYYNKNNHIVTDEYTLEVYDTATSPPLSSNTSTIELGKCKDLLREKYNIYQPSQLIISKIDIITDNSALVNEVQYAIFAPNGTQLDLSVCDEVGIKVNVPIKDNDNINITLMSALTAEGINIFDKGDPFFNDICVPYQSDDSAGMPFYKRKKLYMNSSLCANGCELESIDAESKIANCKCTSKKESGLKELTSDFKNTILNSNFFVIKCFSLAFSSSIGHNSGFFTFMVLFLFQISNMIFFVLTSLDPIKIKLMKIIQSMPNNPTRKTNRAKLRDSHQDQETNIIIEDIHTEGNNLDNKYYKTKALTLLSLDINDENTFTSKNSFASLTKLNCDSTKVLNPNKSINKTTNIITYNASSSIEEKNISYTNEELNELTYNQAFLYDNRNFRELYWEYLKHKQQILNAFILDSDVNLKSIKISMLYLSIGIDLSFNALFFTEEIQDKNYESNGHISIFVTLPKVIFSCIGSVIISTVLSLLSSFARKFNRLKKVTNKEKLSEEVALFMKNLKCKLTIYFTIVFVLMIFFWYFVIAFCAVYPKYQNMWLGDSAKSLLISMLFPFLFALVIVLLRYYGTKKKVKILYRISNIINIV